MRKPLSLTAYLAMARREPMRPQSFDDLRPKGPLLWLHASDAGRARALAKLGVRLSSQRKVSVLLTVPDIHPRPENIPDDIIVSRAPSEHPDDVALFLSYWKPDALLWLGPALRTSVTYASAQRQIPTFLLDAENCYVQRQRNRFIPDPLSATLGMFDLIFARHKAEHARLRKTLPSASKVVESGVLLEDCSILPFNETDLDDLGEALKARPIWLAARLRPDELEPILDAHRALRRLSPRMLLILVPDAASDAATMREILKEQNFSIANWDDGDVPSENTEVLLAEDAQELGLFYRLAPITFLGCSLRAGHGGRNPFEPASLGSAVLYGPSVRKYLDAYSRLAKAGGARIVKDSASLTAALEVLMAPDKVAKMVHAGWETVSEGAEVIDQIVDQVIETLEQKGTI